MELKDFQQEVLDNFDAYLNELACQKLRADEIEKLSLEKPDLEIEVPDYTREAWKKMREAGKLPKSRTQIPFSPRINGIGRPVPCVTFKIPTAGGKTVLATSAVSRIMSKWVGTNYGLVLWIVPNESIYRQTYKTLNNREHLYRQILDRTAAGKVKILEKTTSLNRRDVESHLCVMLLMLQSSNRENKETLKIFKDRGDVLGFFPLGYDFQEHKKLAKEIPNLDMYGDEQQLGCVIKDSMGNVLRVTRPVVVMDEGHKAYSKLAIKTLYDFNPCFVLELSATPADRPNDAPSVYSNWLVDVRGTALDKEEMIKLPINVTVCGEDDWRDCLRKSFEHLNMLQDQADALQAESARYIRPICLVQVERTGKEQRESNFIHAEDAREYLLTLGVREQQIAIKTSEKNDLKSPENLNLLSNTNQVRFIITKQALQEGWDCPFAYVLCSLSPMSNRRAMTQLIGRILRQPETTKTNCAALDECYVFCSHAVTREVVNTIKKGLEQEGMSDLTDCIIETEEDSDENGSLRTLKRRSSFRDLRIYLPEVNWVDGNSIRSLDYEQDILYHIDWNQLNLDGVADQIPEVTQALQTQTVRITLASNSEAKDFVESEEIGRNKTETEFDPLHIVRSISDIVPNPWIARCYIDEITNQLSRRCIKGQKLAELGHFVLEILRNHLKKERDKLAEAIFIKEVETGHIQFRLRTDGHNWIMPDKISTQKKATSRKLYREDGQVVQKDLFEATYVDDLNNYEQNVACYLDGKRAIRWWHRNVAQQQYALQGWRKNKIYPDFIFAMNLKNGNEQIMILETKGDHLDNPDTLYKKQVLEMCKNAFSFEKISPQGELELVINENSTISCALIFEGQWQTELSKLLNPTGT